MSNDPTQTAFTDLSQLLQNYQKPEPSKYITQEFQDYGFRLAVELDDLPHKGLYIKLAKTVDRGILERAKSFVSDANAKSKGKLFMWKLHQLIEEQAKKKPKQVGLFESASDQ